MEYGDSGCRAAAAAAGRSSKAASDAIVQASEGSAKPGSSTSSKSDDAMLGRIDKLQSEIQDILLGGNHRVDADGPRLRSFKGASGSAGDGPGSTHSQYESALAIARRTLASEGGAEDDAEALRRSNDGLASAQVDVAPIHAKSNAHSASEPTEGEVHSSGILPVWHSASMADSLRELEAMMDQSSHGW